MSTEDLDGVVRRRLIVVAIDGYDNQPDGFERAIAEQVDRITGWLADPSLGPDRRFEVSRAPSVRTVDELRDFLRSESLAAASYQEAVVVYITGHGLRRDATRHFLTLPETEPDRPFATAFPTSELITAILDSEAEHVMVLVDSCFSGILRAELQPLFLALSDDRRRHHGLAVVTAGDFKEQPLVGSFTQRLALARERMLDEAAGYTASHLSYAEWEQLLHQVGQHDNGQDKDLISAEWIVPNSRQQQLSACLPNPRYRPLQSTAGPALRQLALPSAAGMETEAGDRPPQGSLDEFWLERASGRAAADDPGWYFSGRAEQMTRVTGFLHGAAGVLIITGAAGSGKSALLARLVTLSDPDFITDPHHEAMVANIPPQLRPAPNSVDVAVMARSKSVRIVVEDLLTALGGEDGTHRGDDRELPLQALIRLVSGRSEELARRVTVVVDALDEAEDPLALVNDVILPLARLRSPDSGSPVRLLLGIRSSPVVSYTSDEHLHDGRADQLLRQLTESLSSEDSAVKVVRTDGPESVGDIAAYVATLLLAPADSPYHGAPEAAAEASRAVAKAVAPSFLDARIAADQLRRAEARQDLTEERWLERLADGTAGLLREDIKAVSLSTNVPAALLVEALRATALAPGAGMPWAEVWPTATAALVAQEYGSGYASPEAADGAIRRLRSSRLTGYLATDEEDARTVYRPVHQRLADLLVKNHDWLLAPPSATASRWRPPVAESQMVTAHAAIAEALAKLVRRSRPHLTHPYIRRHFVQHAAAGNLLTDEAVPLELLAQETSGALRAHLGLPLPAADPERRTLTAAAIIEPYLDSSVDYTSRLSSIVFHDNVRREVPDGLPTVPVWSQWAAPTNVVAPPSRQTAALCVLPTMDGRTLIAAAAAEEARIRVWDAATGERTAELDGGEHPDGIRPIKATGGRTFLVSLDTAGVTIFDPTSGQIITTVSLPGAVEVHVLEDGFALWKLFIRTQSAAYLWRPSPRHTRTPARHPRSGKLVEASGFPPVKTWYGFPKTAVVRRASGHALVAASTAKGIRLWDPVAGLVAQAPFGGRTAAIPTAVARPDKDDLLLVENGPVGRYTEVWNPFTRVRTAQLDGGGRGAVALAGGTGIAQVLRGRLAVRDLDSGKERYFEADVPTVDALAVSEDPAARRVFSAGSQGIRVWDIDGESESEAHPDVRRFRGTQYRTPRAAPPLLHMWLLARARIPRKGADAPVDVLALGTPTGLEIHDAVTGKELKRLDIGEVVAVQALPSAPHTALVAVTGRRSWTVMDLVPGHPVASMHVSQLGGGPSCMALTPAGGPMLVILERPRPATFRYFEWDADAGEVVDSAVVCDWDVGQPTSLVAVPPRWTGDRGVVAAAVAEGILLVDIASGACAGRLRLPAPWVGSQHLCSFTAQGRNLLAASTRTIDVRGVTDDGAAIHVWDTADGTLLASWASPDTLALTGLDLPDGRTLLASGDAGGVRIWDPFTGSLRHSLLTGAPVHALAAGSGPGGTVLHIHGPAGLATVSVDERLL
ncbi:AAA family ATPase [Streptomyces sp. NPDC006335]|uniref:AAA family ATPase n=1 Tax=Streptomyces sp. NPDC006335 TaxID=3156895 RepID=UPI0033B70D01